MAKRQEIVGSMTGSAHCIKRQEQILFIKARRRAYEGICGGVKVWSSGRARYRAVP